MEDAPRDRISLGRILTCTWNIAKRPDTLLDINKWFEYIRARIGSQERDVHFPDIIVVGIQEWTGFVRWTQPRLEEWEAEIRACIHKNFEKSHYQVVRCEKWVGIMLFIALRVPSQAPMVPSMEDSKIQIQEDTQAMLSSTSNKHIIQDHYFWNLDAVEGCFVGTGPLSLGNKGAISFYLDLSITYSPSNALFRVANMSLGDDASGTTNSSETTMTTVRFSLCFINAHLCPGPHQLQNRNEDFRLIYERLRFKRNMENSAVGLMESSSEDRKRNEVRSSNAASIIFWFGDLNFRLFDPSFETEYKRILINMRKQKKTLEDKSCRVTSPNPSMIWPVVGKVLPSNSIQPEYQSQTSNIESLSNAEIVHPFPSSPTSESQSTDSTSSIYSPTFSKLRSEEELRTVDPKVVMYAHTPVSSGRFISDMTYCLQTKHWNHLLSYDQLLPLLNKESAFEGFEEATIQFPPSYKYTIGTQLLTVDDVEKHWPAWCDRILYRCSVQRSSLNSDLEKFAFFRVIPLLYDSCREISTSDHKPVFGFYEISYQERTRSLVKFRQDVPNEPKDQVLKLSLRSQIMERIGSVLSSILLLPGLVLILIGVLAALIMFIVLFELTL